MDEERGPNLRLGKGAQQVERRGVELGMGIALWEKLDESGERADGGESARVVERAGAMGLHELHVEAAEML